MIMKSTGTKGVPEGGVISPMLSNLYLTEVDRMLEKARPSREEGNTPMFNMRGLQTIWWY